MLRITFSKGCCARRSGASGSRTLGYSISSLLRAPKRVTRYSRLLHGYAMKCDAMPHGLQSYFRWCSHRHRGQAGVELRPELKVRNGSGAVDDYDAVQ